MCGVFDQLLSLFYTSSKCPYECIWDEYTKNLLLCSRQLFPDQMQRPKKTPNKNAFAAAANRRHNRTKGITYSRRKGSKIELDTGAEGSD